MSDSIAQSALPFRFARILLAEDLMISQELTRGTLEAIGHQVEVVADGAAALRAVQAGSYDVVLMDVQMPVMDGVEATQSIRALPGPAKTVPIIALTSCTHSTDVARFAPAGMDSYLAKPYSDTALYEAVELWQSEGAQRRAAAAPPDPVCAAFDQSIFDTVAQNVGADRTLILLGMLRKVFCTEINVEPADAAQREIARFSLHSLVSQAGQMGFTGLSQAARALERSMVDDGGIETTRRQFLSAREAAITALDRKIAA